MAAPSASLPIKHWLIPRRALDYLFGFHLSPVLWRKIPVGAKSAGRVQSAALRMLCEREAAIEAFVPQSYWTVQATVALPDGQQVEVGGVAGCCEILTSSRQGIAAGGCSSSGAGGRRCCAVHGRGSVRF